MSRTYSTIFAALETCSLSLFLELILKISLTKIGVDFGPPINWLFSNKRGIISSCQQGFTLIPLLLVKVKINAEDLI